MTPSDAFNLPEFMFTYFNRVDFGGNLFGQWPMEIRFDIGSERVTRAVKLYEFTFANAEDFILVSQDWLSDNSLTRGFTPLFETPSIFPSAPSSFQTAEISPWGESPYLLTWTRLHPLGFDAARMFQAIANRERGGRPAIASAAYAIDPRSRVILHMYDDRGPDILAHETAALLPLYNHYGDWILAFDRHTIACRFETQPE